MNQHDRLLTEDFIEMLSQNEAVVYKICSFYATQTISRDDLYQETVLALWKGYPKFRSESSITTWIWRIALNCCISVIRTEKKHQQNISLTEVSIPLLESESMQQEIKELYRCIAQLKTFDRTLILLWLEEKPYQEIAEITGLSVANVGTRLKRIKTTLKILSNQ
ncbi:MAG: sigma-70 family RNA polymerase sigma factor [Bacteroidales bacterium]|jgi:RNA polymerase sigma-70 factor (ECF subfamily)|nr:sigma-70 family RNA polymerase sigma factor [Bacteroidales bacterium]